MYTKEERNDIYTHATNFIGEFGLCWAIKNASGKNLQYVLFKKLFSELYLFSPFNQISIDDYFWKFDDKGKEARSFALALMIAMTED